MPIIPNESTFYIFNTNVYLLKQYEDMALQISRTAMRVDYHEVNEDCEPSEEINISDENIHLNISMISLNASILEGAIRQVFSASVSKDHHELGAICEQGYDSNSAMFRAYKKIFNLHIELEANGSWDKLKTSLKEYYGIKLEDYMDDPKYFISLFSLRNAIAHGTALIVPQNKIIDKKGDEYLDKWQSRLQEVSVLSNRIFNVGLFDAFRNPYFAKEFMDKTQDFVKKISAIDEFKNNQSFVLENIQKFVFGKRAPSYLHKDNTQVSNGSQSQL